MKRIDYYWPRAALQMTAIIFASQAVTEVIGVRKAGYQWVFPLCGALFAASLAWTLFAIVWNAIHAKEQQ